MPIPLDSIEIAKRYSTPNGQHRVVLGFSEDDRVIYAYGCGHQVGSYNARSTAKRETFAKACNAQHRSVTQDELGDLKERFHV